MVGRSHIFAVAALVALAAGGLWCGISQRQTPIPEGKRAFIGTWRAPSGFTLAIHAEGDARVVQSQQPNMPDSENLNIKVAPPIIAHMRVYFRGDSTMELISLLNYARLYHITRSPYREGVTWHLVLDGVTLDGR